MILAGDIGGTKCNLPLFREEGAELHPVFQRRFATGDYSSFEQLISDFQRQTASLSGAESRVEAAGFGAAGVLVNGRFHSSNLPWPLDASGAARALGLEQIVLLNDLAATAFALERLPSQ